MPFSFTSSIHLAEYNRKLAQVSITYNIFSKVDLMFRSIVTIVYMCLEQ